MKKIINNPYESINPAFYPVWISDKNHNLLKGGRSSGKSSVISEKLGDKIFKIPMANAVCMRQVANTLHKSVYSQMKWALSKMGILDQYKCTVNPMQIIHKEQGTGFYFIGADDPEKLKSLKIPFGFVSDLWFEEMDSFRGEEAIDKIEDTFIRNDLPDGLEVTIWGSWNPPRNPYSWINEYVEKHRNDPDYFIHHSTYLDDVRGYNSKQIIRKIETYKQNDYDYYRWMYLGEVIGLGSNVYNMGLFHPLDELPGNDRVMGLYYSADTGHQVSATTCLCIGVTAKGKVILLDTYYYSPAGRVVKKAPSELSEDLYNFIQKSSTKYNAPILGRTIDSAEGGLRNQYYKDYKIRWNPVAKKKKADMIDFVHNLLAQGRFYYLATESNRIFIEEHKQYQWKEETVNTDDPQVIKENDHTCDAFMYYVVDNARKLGLEA